MQQKVIFLVIFASLGLSACKFPPSIYKKDIRQGNFIKQEHLDQLTTGMDKLQVQNILGTPSHVSAFDIEQWHYHFYFKSGLTGQITHHPLSLTFENKGLKCYTGTATIAHLQACDKM